MATGTASGPTCFLQHDLSIVGQAIPPGAIHSLVTRTDEKNYLDRFPTEVRLIIFEELLVVNPPIMTGAAKFGRLHKEEFNKNKKFTVSAAILQTCSKYHNEGIPIMYGKNKLAFCTGPGDNPGYFQRFPISRRYMPYITDIRIFFKATDAEAISSRNIGHFLHSLAKRATKLSQMTICASTDWHHEQKSPWYIASDDHPVWIGVKDIMLHHNAIRQLKVRMHDGAVLSPGFAQHINHTFEFSCLLRHKMMFALGCLPTLPMKIMFTQSCTCPECPMHVREGCCICGGLRGPSGKRPIEVECRHPKEIEATEEQVMDMQDELFRRGHLPRKDDEEDEDEENEDFWSKEENGIYINGIPADVNPEDKRKAFHSNCLLAGDQWRYRGERKVPKAWRMRQSGITEFFYYIHEEDYLQTIFPKFKRD